jgi:hypothetical protein
LIPWKEPFRRLPEAPAGTGLSNVTVVLVEVVLAGDTAWLTVNVTATVFGLPLAPLAVTVIVPV